MSEQTWLPGESAPKDGSVFLADIGYIQTVTCSWNAHEKKWVFAVLQRNMIDGEHNDTYFENEYATEAELISWMELP